MVSSHTHSQALVYTAKCSQGTQTRFLLVKIKQKQAPIANGTIGPEQREAEIHSPLNVQWIDRVLRTSCLCRPDPLPVKLLCHRLEPIAQGLDWEPQVMSVTMCYFSLKTGIRVQTDAMSSLGYLSLQQIHTREMQRATTLGGTSLHTL